jgi:hypothetical protein
MLQHVRPLLLGILLLAACRGEPVTSASVRQIPCRTVLRVAGPEDFAVDRSASPPRLLVSSRNLRRGKSRPPDGIYSVPLDAHPAPVPPPPLPLVGRDGCSFHPHGVSLTQETKGSRRSLLYVVNHHETEDAAPSRGCFHQTGGSPLRERPMTSIEVFRVEPKRLVFVQRLASPEILTNGNDLVALPNGEVWVTNPPPGRLTLLRERLTGEPASKVVRFTCPQGETLPCSGSWRVALRLRGFANGIAHRTRPGGPEYLYVASTMGKAIHVFEIGQGGLVKRPSIPLATHPDNLEWDPGERSLLVAAHPNLRRFFQHAISPRVSSPSEVWRVSITTGGPPELLFEEGGGLVSAASTGACAGGELFLGQVFGVGVFRCPLPKGCAAQGGDPR